ncbi:hypothetical protein J6590_104195 [Homalodisca vitripennis]|nr:hypothetical protein J6590_104195 [Homalodisca vitripennis]
MDLNLSYAYILRLDLRLCGLKLLISNQESRRKATPPAPLPSPLPHPPPPPRPPATTPQPMGEQQAPHLTRAMADERWRTVSWRMNKNLCLRRPVSEPGPLRMRDCRADHWTTETSCAWRRDMAVRAARGARRYRRSAVVS